MLRKTKIIYNEDIQKKRETVKDCYLQGMLDVGCCLAPLWALLKLHLQTIHIKNWDKIKKRNEKIILLRGNFCSKVIELCWWAKKAKRKNLLKDNGSHNRNIKEVKMKKREEK